MILRLWRDWVRPYRWRVALALLLMGAVAAATGVYPLVIDWIFDVLTRGDVSSVVMLPVVIVAVTGVRAATLYMQTVVTSDVALRVVEDLQRALYRHLTHADLARLQREPIGTLTARFSVDVGSLRMALTRSVTGAVRDILTVAALLVSMIYLDWLLALIVLAVYPVAAIPIVRIGKRVRRNARGTQASYGLLTSRLHEGLSGARMIKAYRLEEHEVARADAAFEDVRLRLARAVRIRGALDPVLEIVGGVAVSAVIAFAAWRIATGQGTVGEFTGFVSALLIAAQPVRTIGNLNSAVQEGLASAERIFEVLDEAPRILDRPGARPLVLPAGRTGGRIELDDVRFGYKPGVPVLKGLTLHVSPGETVALVGRSGGGKSTIFNLIGRFHDVEAGRVAVDGQDVRDVTLASLRDAMALVSQDTVLFDDTVRANIAFGRPGATDAEIMAAARAAAAHDFITALPDGYDTRVGEQGGRLSGGQKQRIALARAFLRDAPILLLDEATSALDAESEQLVQEAVGRLAQGRTTLIIAHRLSTVRAADRICVVEDGRVVEQGSHEDLLRRGGRYADLHAIQFRPAEV
ncbi:MAG TPA: ABC transporter ATP-binding protein [Azospirillaceae bacterium]|nr:ABC transporter ATP-binding protein [Azospirillaceae bacterium]